MVPGMNKNLKVLIPRWIICLDDDNRVLENHALVVDGNLISAIVPWPEATERYKGAEITELPDQALLPGLINSHTHLAMNLLRGYADDPVS